MEFQNFGWNALTISLIGRIFFTLFGAWGLIHQNKRIWKHREEIKTKGLDEPLSFTWFMTYFFMFIAFILYGSSQSSIALMFHGYLHLFLHIPILVMLYLFKGITNIEKWFFLILAVLISVMGFSPASQFFFILFSLIGVAATSTQPWNIWQKKSSGNVSIKLLIPYTLSTVFWIFYSFAFNDLAMQVMSFAYIIVHIITVYLWIKYRENGVYSRLHSIPINQK